MRAALVALFFVLALVASFPACKTAQDGTQAVDWDEIERQVSLTHQDIADLIQVTEDPKAKERLTKLDESLTKVDEALVSFIQTKGTKDDLFAQIDAALAITDQILAEEQDPGPATQRIKTLIVAARIFLRRVKEG